MPNPTPLPIKNVIFPTHLEAFVFTETATVEHAKDPQKPEVLPPFVTGKDPVKLEVFKGWIVTSFNVNNTMAVEREEFISFLPIEPFVVNQYSSIEDLIDIAAVMVTTSSVAEVGDEDSLFAVDTASVEMESEGYPGDSREKDARVPRLILRATVAAKAATVHTICYDVTVLTRNWEKRVPKLYNTARLRNVAPIVA